MKNIRYTDLLLRIAFLSILAGLGFGFALTGHWLVSLPFLFAFAYLVPKLIK